jgi:hypothetical protein
VIVSSGSFKSLHYFVTHQYSVKGEENMEEVKSGTQRSTPRTRKFGTWETIRDRAHGRLQDFSFKIGLRPPLLGGFIPHR